jgi:nitrogen fixation/metabolism regulation signal transduction histidine kinase
MPPDASRPPALQTRAYLINPRFQLKYTALLIAVVLSVMAVLGLVIGRTASEASDYAQLAALEAERAMNESRANSALARQNVALAAVDNPELAKMMDDSLQEANDKALRNLEEVRRRRGEIEAKREKITKLLLASGLALGLLLGAMGILITHRVVGPVHKIKRLLRQVGTGRLVVKERLRHGDELSDLFDTFLQMTYSLKALQIGRMATLDATIRAAEASRASAQVLSGLRALHAQMALGLGVHRRSSVPPPDARIES